MNGSGPGCVLEAPGELVRNTDAAGHWFSTGAGEGRRSFDPGGIWQCLQTFPVVTTGGRVLL